MIILFAKLEKLSSLPKGLIHSISFKTINCDMDDNGLDNDGTYYEVIKHDKCQKPYFIWMCDRDQCIGVIKHVTQAIKDVFHHSYDEIVTDNDICLVEIDSDNSSHIYHLLVMNYYHADGLEAQQCRELILSKLDPVYRSMLMESKEDCRKYTRHILYQSLNLRRVILVGSDIVPVPSNRLDNTSSLISYARGKLLTSVDGSVSSYGYGLYYMTRLFSYVTWFRQA